MRDANPFAVAFCVIAILVIIGTIASYVAGPNNDKDPI